MKSITPYIQRDISWLSFNYRVLQEANDPKVPLLERIKFMAIYSSNLDEFFRVRVANHRNLLRLGKKAKKELDFEPKKVLEQLLKIVNEQQLEFSKMFFKHLIPELEKQGICLIRQTDFSADQTEFIEDYFKDNLLPFVQPVLLFEDKIKPFLNNGSLYLAVALKNKQKTKEKRKPKENSDVYYAIVKVPSDHLSRFVVLPHQKDKEIVVLLDDIVRHCLPWIFPGFDILNSFSIKLTRDAELYIDDEFSGDLMSKVKKSLRKRNVGPASRMVYDREMPNNFLNYLCNVFDLESLDLLPEGRYHNNSDFFKFPSFGKTHLKDNPAAPVSIDDLENTSSIFSKITKQDYMVTVPYQSYESVIKFFEDAAQDPKVTHIKIVQYRVAESSRIMQALIQAAKSGKQVFAFIEIKARFDEEANLEWGEILEKNGVQVKYSMPGLKVHSKMALVRKIEAEGPKLYSLFSTGNFNEDTAKVYSDMTLLTANEPLSMECARLFTFLETKEKPTEPFEHLLVGQFGIKEKLIALVQQEIKAAQNGKTANIVLKMNSLQDLEMIKLLYQASQAGVTIKLIIRGICSLVPGLKGISDNIEAISIVDKYLEHARIFKFHNNGDQKYFLSSADWMTRNLHKRIETIFPIYDINIQAFIEMYLKFQMRDNIKARKIEHKKTNNYKKTDIAIASRSQVEVYHYIKRIKK